MSFFRVRLVECDQKFNHANEQKKIAPLRAKNDVTKLERIFSSRKSTRFFAPLPVSAWPKSLLQFDFKNHKNVWTDLKKRQRPNTIQILWIVKSSLNCKKPREGYRCAAIKKYLHFLNSLNSHNDCEKRQALDSNNFQLFAPLAFSPVTS